MSYQKHLFCLLKNYIPEDDLGLNSMKLPTKEEIFGKINEITAQYQDENEKIIRQMNDHKVGWATDSANLIYLNISTFRRNRDQNFRINWQQEDREEQRNM